MRKVVLFFMALCAVAVSCQKTTKVPVSYTVESLQNTPLGDIYIPDSGTYTLPVLVKYMTGYHEDKVTVSIKGLPADIKVAEDSFSEVPTYRANFVLNTSHAVHATYPITVTASAPGTKSKIQTFNITVIEADCASTLWGNFNGTNQCTSRTYAYTATGIATGVANTLAIKNLGGYGPTTLTQVTLNCAHDSLFIPMQNIGNGTNLSGYGTFTPNSMTIYYTATTTPGGFPETCNVTLTR